MDNEQSLGLFMKSMSFIFMFFFTYKYSIVSTAAEPSRLYAGICRLYYTFNKSGRQNINTRPL